MRRFKRAYFAGAVMAVSALAVPAISSASHGVQPADVFFTSTGKETGKGAPGTLDIRLGPAADDPSNGDPVPPKPSVVQVDLSQGITVDGSKFPVCDPALLEGATPDVAQAACGNTAPKDKNALVATGDAKATLNAGGVAQVVDASALAFNGANGAIIVYARVEALAATTIVPCALGPAPDTTLYKTRFTCNVPPLQFGAGSLTTFNLKFDRVEKIKPKKSHDASASKKKKKKKVASIVFGKCPASAIYAFQVSWTYTDHEPESRQISQSC